MSRTWKHRPRENLTPTISLSRCGASRKVGFPSHDIATARAAAIMDEDPTANLRVYRCQFCSLYHFSSREKVKPLDSQPRQA